VIKLTSLVNCPICDSLILSHKKEFTCQNCNAICIIDRRKEVIIKKIGTITSDQLSRIFKLRKIPEEWAFIFVLVYITKNPRAKLGDIVLDLHLDIGLTVKILEDLKKMNFIEVREK